MKKADATEDSRLQRRFEGIAAAELAQAQTRTPKYVVLFAAVALMVGYGWPPAYFFLFPIYVASDYTFTRHVRRCGYCRSIDQATVNRLLAHHGLNMATFALFGIVNAFLPMDDAHRAAALILFGQALHTIGVETRSYDVTRVSVIIVTLSGQIAAWGMTAQDAPLGDRLFLHFGIAILSAFFVHVSLNTARTREALEDRNVQLAHVQKGEIVGRLTSGIAHDFNNLLTVIRGNLDLMKEVPATETDRLLEEIGDASDRGAYLVAQLLKTSRRAEQQVEVVEIGAFLDRFATFARRVLPANIALAISAPEGTASISIDVARLEAALLNLVVNARDALVGGGTIEIVAAFDNRDGAAYVRLAVKDDGPGIPPEILARAMDPYVTTKAPGEGTGLGLAMVAAFAAQIDGLFTLQSAPGRGAEAVLWLPR